MCVIAIIEEKRPTTKMIEQMWEKNDDGGGLAWQEKGTVKWVKGIDDVGIMHDMIAKLPTPFVAHFRIASQGGKSLDLTHPFELSPTARTTKTGTSKSGVLFHNGTLTGWRENMLNYCINSANKVPDGAWNDSRAMAWMAAHMGLGVLELFDQKLVALLPSDIRVYGSGWKEVDGIWCSNDFFRSHTQVGGAYGGYRHGHGTVVGGTSHGVKQLPAAPVNDPIVTVITTVEKAGGPSLLQLPFRGTRPNLSADGKASGGNQSKAVSTTSEEVGDGTDEGGGNVAEASGPKITEVTSALPTNVGSESEWAKGINNKSFRGHTKISEYMEQRRRAAAAGITYLGRM